MKNFNLNKEQEEEFNNLVKEKHQLIFLALKKVNIPPRLYEEFYVYALDGLLVSYLILKARDIEEHDFNKFAFVTMKRKIIDELRRRNRHKIITFEEIEKTTLFSEKDYDVVKFELFSSLASILTNKEKIFFSKFMETNDFQKTIKTLKISKSQGYRLLSSIKDKCQLLLLNKK